MNPRRLAARLLLCPALALLPPGAPAQPDTSVSAPFVTTPAEVVDRMLALAGTQPSDYVVDLGSGDGRIVIAAAKKFGARALGLELDPKLVEQSRAAARAAGVAERAEFRVEDVLRADFSRATVVTVYLLPWLMAELSPLFLEGLQPGARIVTHAFAFPGWKPDRTQKVRLAVPHPSQGDESAIFLWVVPANARGHWHAASPEGAWRLRIDQNFQEVELEGDRAGTRLDIASPTLEGAQLAFSGAVRGETFTFKGHVEKNRIAGTAEMGTARRSVALVFTK